MLISHAMTDTKYINTTIIPGKSFKGVSQISPLYIFVFLKNDNKILSTKKIQNVSFNMLISHAMTDTKYINNTIIPGKSFKEVSQITPLYMFNI